MSVGSVKLELRGDAAPAIASMGRARRAVLRNQLEVAEELGHAFVEVPTDLLREMLELAGLVAELGERAGAWSAC